MKMASSSSYGSPCAACKFLRRKCMAGQCIFAPHFPPEEPHKFANVHKIFGASNVSKLLLELLPHQRDDAVSSLAYEAEARVRDPVYGCVAAITFLQSQVERLQRDLDAANAGLITYYASSSADHDQINTTVPPPLTPLQGGRAVPSRENLLAEVNRKLADGGGGGGFRQTPTFPYPDYPYPLPWRNNPSGDENLGAGEASI